MYHHHGSKITVQRFYLKKPSMCHYENVTGFCKDRETSCRQDSEKEA